MSPFRQMNGASRKWFSSLLMQSAFLHVMIVKMSNGQYFVQYYSNLNWRFSNLDRQQRHLWVSFADRLEIVTGNAALRPIGTSNPFSFWHCSCCHASFMFTISNPTLPPFLHSPYPKLAVKQMPPSGHANDQVENCNGQTPSSCEQPIQSLSANFFPFSNWMKINHIPPSLALKTHGIWWMNDNFQFLAREKISSVNESGGGKTERRG